MSDFKEALERAKRISTPIHAMEQACRVIRHMMPEPKLVPSEDSRYIAMKQLHAFNQRTLKQMEKVEHEAHMARLAAMAACAETKVRVELLEDELGIEKPDPESRDGVEKEYEEHA